MTDARAVAFAVAGFGHRHAADLDALYAAFVSAQHGRPRVTTLAAPHDKSLLVSQLAAMLDMPMIVVSSINLKAVVTLSGSSASLASHGVGSVAEAAALAAAGPGARLLAPRHISPDRMATCAIAQGYPA